MSAQNRLASSGFTLNSELNFLQSTPFAEQAAETDLLTFTIPKAGERTLTEQKHGWRYVGIATGGYTPTRTRPGARDF